MIAAGAWDRSYWTRFRIWRLIAGGLFIFWAAVAYAMLRLI